MGAVAVPLKTLAELLEWKAKDIPTELQRALNKICDIELQEPGLRPQTLLCHDMKGGYIEDRFLEGCCDNEAYRFVHWHSIDWFVYFSHSFVTIPPPGWTTAAHKNGVPVLGTLITEGPPGQDLCKEMFSSLQMVERSVVNLVNIAKHHKLHGWLINIENKIDPVAVGLVIIFLQKLTAAMKTVVPCARVVWYDSVTHAGDLRWQDQLNGQNSCFYEACDAIFLNYSWSVEKLQASRSYARSLASRPLPGISTLPDGDGGSGAEGDGITVAGEGDRSIAVGKGDERDGDRENSGKRRRRDGEEQRPSSISITTGDGRGDDDGRRDNKDQFTSSHHRSTSSEAVSLSDAMQKPEETKVFVGVDVFGRNFYEGGGFNCHKALAVIRSLGLSAAVFAPGWTHEALGRPQFPSNDTKFWRLLAPHLREAGPSRYPLVSCFSDGCGSALYSHGRVVDPKPWYNLALQDLLPSLLTDSGGRGDQRCTAEYDHSDAYSGGSCLLLRNASEQPAAYTLWSNCRLQVRALAPLQVKLAYKWEGPLPPGGEPVTSVSSTEYSLDIDLSQHSPAVPSRDGATERLPSEAPQNGWLVRQCECGAYDGFLRKIRVRLPRDSALKLGRLHVHVAHVDDPVGYNVWEPDMQEKAGRNFLVIFS